ncbi:regulator of G-protein signaling 5a [Stegastes partitus]|uniref:Regulator of G-protein signaling 5-like n=1 Tax=Stegastes partitus TaxID=144197 RepID=A0A3B4ZE48_9TELE|nr:PREDICTED: regulator of G-protein signaling 5-like [Stegastes partitus]
MCKGLAALPQTCLERAKEIKSKLGVLLQKPENAIDLIIPYPEKTEKKPEKLQKPTADEAAQWRESLDRVLNNNYGLAAFRSFLQSEFSDENIEFWMACEDFKKTKNPVKMSAKAKKIYENFIQSEGPREVNIDHFTKDVTLRNLVDLSSGTFDLAQKRIYALMEKDSFGRFLRSEQYQELLVN